MYRKNNLYAYWIHKELGQEHVGGQKLKGANLGLADDSS